MSEISNTLKLLIGRGSIILVQFQFLLFSGHWQIVNCITTILLSKHLIHLDNEVGAAFSICHRKPTKPKSSFTFWCIKITKCERGLASATNLDIDP